MSSRALLASAWTVVILAIFLVPSDWLPVAEARLSSSHFLLPRDKLVHSGMFAILSVLWMRVMPTRGWTVLVSVGGLALAILTELGQGLPMIGRDPDRLDALADAVGTFVGVGVFWALRGLAVASPPAEPDRSSTPEY
ncbi:MAG: VanZ family protein [Singulisphaera sp.]